MLINNDSGMSQALIAKLGVSGGAMGSAKNMTPEKAEAVSKDFEALFISQMMEPMFGDSIGADAFGAEDTDEIYKNLMVKEYGKLIVQSGGMGIAQNIYRGLMGENKLSSGVNGELLKQQEYVGGVK